MLPRWSAGVNQLGIFRGNDIVLALTTIYMEPSAVHQRSSSHLPHLETFVRAAELSNFTATARALRLTQAAISKRIHVLEKALGVPLFRREGGKLLLTDAGQRLHDYARRIFALHDEARRELAGRHDEVSGELTIGASTIPGEHFLPALLPAFREKYPAIQVRVAISDSGKVLEQVERGQVSLGMVGLKNDNPHLEFKHHATDRMRLVLPPRHPWNKRRRITLRQLREQPMILREVGSGSRHCLEKSLAQTGLSTADMQVTLELGSNEAIKEAVLQGLGVAVLSTHAVGKEVKARTLRTLPISDLRCDRDIYVVWDRRRVLSAPARVFRFFLETRPKGVG